MQLETTLLISIVCIIRLSASVPSSRLGPPELMKNLKRDKIFALAGEDVKLICPVNRQSLSRPIIEWFRGDEAINARIWKNYKQTQNYLQIKNASVQDGGRFRCQATNGFGKLTVLMELSVIGDMDTQSEVVDTEEEKESSPIQIPLGQAKPTFLQVTRNHRKVIQRPAGSSARLKCMPSGKPDASVKWLKDGKPLKESDLSSLSKIRRYTLQLADLRTSDSGKYMCKASNIWGSINASFQIEVVDKIKNKPKLIGPHPKDSTVVEGGSASFLCQMHSESYPHIQWLKEIDFDLATNKSKVIVLQEKYYKVLGSTEGIQRSDGMYMNKLVLSNVSEKDAGIYICFGANNMGYNSRVAHLSVIKRNGFNGQSINSGSDRLQHDSGVAASNPDVLQHDSVVNFVIPDGLQRDAASAPDDLSSVVPVSKNAEGNSSSGGITIGLFVALFLIVFIITLVNTGYKCIKKSSTTVDAAPITTTDHQGAMFASLPSSEFHTNSWPAYSHHSLIENNSTNQSSCWHNYKHPQMPHYSDSNSSRTITPYNSENGNRGVSEFSDTTYDSVRSKPNKYFIPLNC